MYVISLRNRRTGERFTSKHFATFEAASIYGDRLDTGKWDWSIEPV